MSLVYFFNTNEVLMIDVVICPVEVAKERFL